MTAFTDPAQHFASDNYAGICPEARAALIEANTSGHEPAYGDDSWTQQVCDRIRDLFQTDCEVFFVFNGTAANSLALASLCQSYHSVICHELAHIETDECGGPEFFFRWLEAAHRERREWQAHARCDRGTRHQTRGHPLSEAEGRRSHAGDGSRHGVHYRRNSRDRGHR